MPDSKEIWYKKASTWIAIIGLLVSIAAIYVATQSNSQSQKAFEWTVEQSRLEKIDSILVNAEWKKDILILSHFTQRPDSINSMELYDGLASFIYLKLSNVSNHTISIDRIKIQEIRSNTLSTKPVYNIFTKNDLNTKIEFPIIIPPKEQVKICNLVPIPVIKRITTYFKEIDTGIYLTNVLAKDFANRYSEFSIFKDIIPYSESIFYYYIMTRKTNEWIMVEGDREIVANIYFSSGKKISDTLDYIHISGSIDFF